MDNIMVERLWRSLKYEDIYTHDYETMERLLTGLRAYLDFYNDERPRQTLEDNAPAEVCAGLVRLEEAA